MTSTRQTEFVNRLSARLGRLSDPIVKDVLDPLILESFQFASSQNNGTEVVVGVVMSHLLRAATNKQQYPLCLVVDALVRAQKQLPFQSYFEQKLETVFCSAFEEADMTVKTKMLKLLTAWEGNLPHRPSPTFNIVLLQRIRAMCDENYQGTPLEYLPKPALVLPAELSPPFFPAAAAAVAVPHQTYPPRGVVAAGYPYGAPPVGPPSAVDPNAVFARANELLFKLYGVAQPPVPREQRMPLPWIQQYNVDLYTQLMNQAYYELLNELQKPQQAPPLQHMMRAPSPVRVFGGMTSVPPPMQKSAAITATPGIDFSLKSLTAKSLLDKESVHAIVLAMAAGVGIPSLKSKAIPHQAGLMYRRTWLLGEDEWMAGEKAPTEQVHQLFNDSPRSESPSEFVMDPKTMYSSMDVDGGGSDENIREFEKEGEDDPMRHLVAKDVNHPRCALTDEVFETVWSDDDQSWMYKGAIRPHPQGPIYKYGAWRATNTGGVDERTAKKARME